MFKEFKHKSKLNVAIVGLVGGPGSGKGTQCERLAKSLPLEHLSVGDILREEMASERSPYAHIIRDNMTAGRVGPPELTVGLLHRRMELAMSRGVHTFILDGFPRNIAQCEYLENMIASVQRVIVLECSDSVLVDRLAAAKRGRFDDGDEQIILRRIKTFRDTTSHVVAIFEDRKKVTRIDGEQDVETVAAQVYEALQDVVQRPK